MATNFPSSLDSLTNPTSTDALNSPSHADQHANVNDAVEALEAKVGVDGSAVTSSLDFKVTASKTVTDKIDPAGASADQVLKFNGTKFVPATGSSLTASDTPPGSPVAGELWYESDTGRTFIRYDSAWVEIGSTATTNVNANDLSGTTLASNVVSSSLTSVGTLGSLAVTNDITRGGKSLPRGIINTTSRTTNITNIGTSVTEVLSLTVSVVSGRSYAITGLFTAYKEGSSNYAYAFLYKDGSQIARLNHSYIAAGTEQTLTGTYFDTPSSTASVTYSLRVQFAANTLNEVRATSTTPAQLTVVDVGVI